MCWDNCEGSNVKDFKQGRSKPIICLTFMFSYAIVCMKFQFYETPYFNKLLTSQMKGNYGSVSSSSAVFVEWVLATFICSIYNIKLDLL